MTPLSVILQCLPCPWSLCRWFYESMTLLSVIPPVDPWHLWLWFGSIHDIFECDFAVSWHLWVQCCSFQNTSEWDTVVFVTPVSAILQVSMAPLSVIPQRPWHSESDSSVSMAPLTVILQSREISSCDSVVSMTTLSVILQCSGHLWVWFCIVHDTSVCDFTTSKSLIPLSVIPRCPWYLQECFCSVPETCECCSALSVTQMIVILQCPWYSTFQCDYRVPWYLWAGYYYVDDTPKYAYVGILPAISLTPMVVILQHPWYRWVWFLISMISLSGILQCPRYLWEFFRSVRETCECNFALSMTPLSVIYQIYQCPWYCWAWFIHDTFECDSTFLMVFLSVILKCLWYLCVWIHSLLLVWTVLFNVTLTLLSVYL
jgi:hypothetical protein